MTKDNYIIREIQAADNEQIAEVIRNVLIEFGVPKVGTAYEDMALDFMYETYDIPNATYFVVEKDGALFGGAGIMQLEGSDENICELQKMYFSSKVRGIGLGSAMMTTCLARAKQFGFEKCYLETLPYMVGARKLYESTGFSPLKTPLGNTGHFSCNMWMIKNL